MRKRAAADRRRDKDRAGKRIITLPPSTAQLLSERRKRSYTEWIFPDPLHPERPTRPNAAYVRMKELLKKAGFAQYQIP
mgnify:CR=1 FL=1